MHVFTVHFNLTLREIERAFTLLALYYGSLPKNQLTHGLLVAFLAVLRVKRPTLYRALMARSLDAEQFFKDTRLDQIEKNVGDGLDRDWVIDFLNFCLMSDAEFEKVPEGKGPRLMGQWLIQYNLDRRKVVQFLGERLERFSLQPANG